MATPQPLAFAELLRRYRQAAGLTQEKLAERAQLSARAIGELERGGRRTPRKDTVALLADALRLSGLERALLEAAARGHSPATHGPPRGRGALGTLARSPMPILVGRLSERDLIHRQLTGEATPLVLLAGEPGIGKSRLLAEAAIRAREHGWTVLAGGCHRRSGQEPYAPFVGTLAHFLSARSAAQQRLDLQGCAWLVRLLPELAEHATVPAPSWNLPPEQERRLMFTAVARFCTNVAGPAGTLLILDDLHWAAADAIDLLAALLRDPTAPSLRLVGAYRDTDVAPRDPLPMLLADLLREGLATRLPLGPLERGDAAELLANLLAEMPDMQENQRAEAGEDARRAVLERAGGVPFYLVSCAQGISVDRLASPRTDVPWSVAESIRQRQVTLPDAAREILSIAAVAGRQVSRGVLLGVALATGLMEAQVLDALDAVCHARLMVEVANDSYTFAHDLIRETVAGDLGRARRAAFHRRVAEVLEELPNAPQRAPELAWHFAEGDAPGRAVPYLLQAGSQAEAVYAHDEAEHHYRSAAELARELGDTDRQAEALEKLADVLYRLARYREAVTILDEATVLYRNANNWERLTWATAEMAKAGDQIGLAEVETSLTRVDQLITLLAGVADIGAGARLTSATQPADSSPGAQLPFHPAVPSPDAPEALEARVAHAVSLLTPRTAARLSACLGSRLHQVGRHEEACVVSEGTVVLARAANDRRLESLAYAFRAGSLQMLGRLDEAWTAAQASREAALASGDLDALWRALSHASRICALKGEHVQRRDILLEALQSVNQLGDRGQIVDSLCGLASVAFLLGDWDEARSRYVQAQEAAQQWDLIGLEAPAIGLAHLDLVQGRVGSPSAESILAHVAERGEEPYRRTVAVRALAERELLAVRVLAERDLLAGRAREARTRLEWVLDGDQTNPPEAVGLVALAAWAQWETGQQAQARQVLAETQALLGARQHRMARVEIERVEALIAVREGRWQDAQRALDQTLALSHAMPYPYAEAKALYVYGQMHAAKGDLALARDAYEQALAICARLGERLYAERIEQVLASLDLPVEPQFDPQRPTP